MSVKLSRMMDWLALPWDLNQIGLAWIDYDLHRLESQSSD